MLNLFRLAAGEHGCSILLKFSRFSDALNLMVPSIVPKWERNAANLAQNVVFVYVLLSFSEVLVLFPK